MNAICISSFSMGVTSNRITYLRQSELYFLSSEQFLPSC